MAARSTSILATPPWRCSARPWPTRRSARAVAAAEAIQRAMPILSADLGRPATAPLLSHIGIALGEVVAGEIGGAVRRDYTVLGDTVNLASRLVGEAGPGEIVLDDATWRAVRPCAWHVARRTRPEGIAKPQRLWRLDELREGPATGRLPFVAARSSLPRFPPCCRRRNIELSCTCAAKPASVRAGCSPRRCPTGNSRLRQRPRPGPRFWRRTPADPLACAGGSPD